MYALVSGVLFTHALVMWEAYFTGEVILNYIEACTEGVFVIGTIHMYAGLLYPDLWKITVLPPGVLGWFPEGVSIQALAPVISIGFYTTALASVKRVLYTSYSNEGLYSLVSLLPFMAMWGLNILFRVLHEEESAVHFHLWIICLCSHCIWWIHIFILSRLTGRKLNFANLFCLPLTFPFILLLVAHLFSPKIALLTIPRITFVIYFMWWLRCVLNLSKKLEKPLLSVPLKTKEQ
jgi:hypothetical protein